MELCLREEISTLREKLIESQSVKEELRGDVHVLVDMVRLAQGNLSNLQTELGSVSEDLAGIYYHVCSTIRENPSRVLLNHTSGPDSKGEVSGCPIMFR